MAGFGAIGEFAICEYPGGFTPALGNRSIRVERERRAIAVARDRRTLREPKS